MLSLCRYLIWFFFARLWIHAEDFPPCVVVFIFLVFSRDPIFPELFLFVPRSSFFFSDFIFRCSYFAISLELQTGASLIRFLTHRWQLASASWCLLFLQSLSPIFARSCFFGARRSVLVERSSEAR
jgi:hypothetical protein